MILNNILIQSFLTDMQWTFNDFAKCLNLSAARIEALMKGEHLSLADVIAFVGFFTPTIARLLVIRKNDAIDNFADDF